MFPGIYDTPYPDSYNLVAERCGLPLLLHFTLPIIPLQRGLVGEAYRISNTHCDMYIADYKTAQTANRAGMGALFVCTSPQQYAAARFHLSAARWAPLDPAEG